MPSITTELTNQEYRAQKGYSKSDLDYANKSVALIEWNKNNPAGGSESVDLGTHVHCALLEPNIFEENYVKTPEFNLRTNSGKDSFNSFKRSISEEKILLSNAEYEKVIAMRDSVLHHPVAKMLLKSSGVSEASIFGEINGLRVKCRPDRIVDSNVFGQHILIDAKKTVDIDKFRFSVRDFRYHVQAAFYSDIYKQLTGYLPRFVFVVVSETRAIGRHQVRVWELTQEQIHKGRKEYLKDIEAIKEYEEFGCGLDIETLNFI